MGMRSSPARKYRNRWRKLKFGLICNLSGWLSGGDTSISLAANNPETFNTVVEKPLEADVENAAALVNSFSELLDRSHTPVGFYWRMLHDPGINVPKYTGRQRDAFPLPLLSTWPEDIGIEMGVSDALTLTNMCIAGLNLLHVDFNITRVRSCVSLTDAQRSIHMHIASRCSRYASKMGKRISGSDWWKGGFAKYGVEQVEEKASIVASHVDMPTSAATCDPLKLIPRELADQISDPSKLFPTSTEPTLALAKAAMEPNREEYVRLTVRGLACGRLRLRRQVQGAGGIFVLPKSTPGHLREIWNGSWLSSLAAEPPAPTRLGNPGCFVDVIIPRGQLRYFSKRDVSTCFDALRAPEGIQKFFGRPGVTVRELLDCSGWSLEALFKHIDDFDEEEFKESITLYPVSVVLPMGFNWPSCIAQACSVQVALDAGIDLESIMSLDEPMPCCQEELCAIVTDDTVLIHANFDQGAERLERLVQSMQEAGFVKNLEKDVTLQNHIVALGCEIGCSPALVEPSESKLFEITAGLVDLLLNPIAATLGVHSVLGVLQWFFQLQRGMYSILDAIYGFVRVSDQRTPRALPEAVQNELLVSLLLLPLLPAGLDRTYCNELVACDASQDYGFGVVAKQCAAETLQHLGTLAERRGDYIRLFTEEGDPPRKPRIGRPHRLGFRKSEFRVIVSARARWRAHSSVLEGHALLLALRWLSRQADNHHTRACILVDAKAIIGCAGKGRSSAPALRGILRAVATHCLSSDILLRLIYVPSEDNPADLPSRGRRVRVPRCKRARRRSKNFRFATRFERWLDRHITALARLYECGALDLDS